MMLTFYKYQGTGNDFIMIDNRDLSFKKDTKIIAHLCDRRFGIGADGLILLENDNSSDFKMVYYNADGHESTMCGNGGRCIVAFAKKLAVIQNQTTFSAIDGLHNAKIDSDNRVDLQMNDVKSIEVNETFYFLNTGSPHHVEWVENAEKVAVKKEGAEIRYSDKYKPNGTNVNFVQAIDVNRILVRTYERGVEDETLSCGTGVTAAALAYHFSGKTESKKIDIQTLGGNLQVSFDFQNKHYSSVFLIGPTQFVFQGTIDLKK